MKRLLLAALLLPALGMAADVTIDWDITPNVDEFRVYQSNDLGVTWTLAAASQTLPITVTNVPDTGLVLFRAVNASNDPNVAEAVRLETGFFYNGDWLPLVTPSNIGTP